MEKSVLVVDDEAGIREMMKAALEAIDCKVVTAADAETALGVMAGQTIDIALLDLKMPGVTGLDLCRMIRERYPVTVLYAMTGHVSLFEVVRAREAGFDDYFTKPVDLKSLTKAVNDGFERLERWRRRPGGATA